MTYRVRLPGRVPAAYRLPRRGGCRCDRHDLGARRVRQQWFSAAGAAAPPPPAGASGTLNWEWELPTSWDPVTSSAGWDMHALGLVYASITTLDPKGTVQAGLASSWKYAANGKTVTFRSGPD